MPIPSSIGLVNAAGLPKRYQQEVGRCRSCRTAGADRKGQAARPSPPPCCPPLPPSPAPLRRPFPAQRPTDDRRPLLLTEFALGPSRPGNHLQDPGRWGWPRCLPGAGPGRRGHWGGRLVVGRFGATTLQGLYRGLQRQDRAGPFGGQDLGSLPPGALQLQGMLKRLGAIPLSQGTARFSYWLVVLRMTGWWRGLPVQASPEQVLGRDPPLPGLTGDPAWLLPGAREAPGAQVATDRGGRHVADLGGLGNGQGLLLLQVVTALLLSGQVLVAHIRSLSRPAMPYPAAPVVAVVCDNVIIHRSKLVNRWLATLPRLIVLHGARYSPHDNPVEHIWGASRRGWPTHRP